MNCSFSPFLHRYSENFHFAQRGNGWIELSKLMFVFPQFNAIDQFSCNSWFFLSWFHFDFKLKQYIATYIHKFCVLDWYCPHKYAFLPFIWTIVLLFGEYLLSTWRSINLNIPTYKGMCVQHKKLLDCSIFHSGYFAFCLSGEF